MKEVNKLCNIMLKKGFTICALIFLNSFICYSQPFSESSKKFYKYNLRYAQGTGANNFTIFNVNGSIELIGHNGDELQIEIEKKINARTKVELQKADREIDVGVSETNGGIYFYVKSPYSKYIERKGKISNFRFSFTKDRGGPFQNTKNHDYIFSLNYKVKLPKNSNVFIENINGQMVEIKYLDSEAIKLRNVKRTHKVG